MNKSLYFLISFLTLFTCATKTTAAEPATRSTEPTKEIWEDIFEATNNERGWPALHYALCNNNFEAAEWLADKYPETISLTTPDIKVMRWMDPSSDKRSNHHAYNGIESGYDALELALMKDQTALAIKFLQDHELDINAQKQRYQGPYLNAWYKEDRGVYYTYKWVREWVKEIERRNGYERYITTIISTTPLYWAILTFDSRPLNILLSKNVNLQNIYSETYLGNVQKPNDFYLDALEVAAAWGSDEALKLIITHISCIEDISDETIQVFRMYGQNPHEGSLLLKAMQADDVIGFEILLNHGADPYNIVVASSQSLFSIAIDNPNRLYADILMTRFPAQAYLLDAIHKDQIDVLNDLLAYGLGSPEMLHEAISLGKADAAALLIANDQLDAKAVEMIIEKDFDKLFFEVLNKDYPLSNIQSIVIEKNAMNIATLILDLGIHFSREDLLRCVQFGRLNILKLCNNNGLILIEDKELLLVKAIKCNQHEIFAFLLGL